ncbi:MAG TPA: SDR family NAD(P)-dependent oxidoreductase [Alphaproteobacteria bacterium]|nr:SDR family NAD(P)-dependent oxidoreductase [Alphaproteobacteria bacterium]
MQAPKHIVITGASSGIGKALAEAYAAPGRTLGLMARRAELLENLAQSLRQRGAEVWTAAADVTDREATARILEEADNRLPVDLLIANAGISGGTFGAGESATQARAIFNVNLEGALNTVFPLIPRMSARRRGQIALMASLAGFRGFPAAPAYCASKAALRIYGEGLRGELAPLDVEVNVICPGYIDTPMTQANHFPMPFLMTVARAADIIINGLARNQARIAFPFPTALAAWLLGVLPPAWTDGLLIRLPKKAPLKQA